MPTLEESYDDLMHFLLIKKHENPALFLNKLREIKAISNIWKTITADVGSTIASTSADIFVITGGTNITTTIVGDTLTIDGAATLSAISEIASPTTIDIKPSGDNDDYIQFKTDTNVPQINTQGGCDLKIAPASGELDLNAALIKNVGTVDGIDIPAIALDNMPTVPTGDVGFNAQNITGVGNVDGIDISAISITNMPTAVNNWKVYYTNGSGVMTELALGAAGEVLTAQGAAVAPTFAAAGAPDTYYCNTEADINAAITAIGAGAGTIILESGTITLTAAITINIAGSVIIQGMGDLTVIDINGDYKTFDITGCAFCILRDFKIDATDLTTAAMEIIDITEAAGNKVVIDNITIIGDGTNGYGVEVNSNECTVKNCYIKSVGIGIRVLSNLNTIDGNNCNTNNLYGISLDTSNYTTVVGNTCYDNDSGIYLYNNSKYNNITDNNCYSNNDAGIYIITNNHANTISGNNCHNNTNYGIYVRESNYVTVTGNNCTNNGGVGGIYFYFVYDSTITGNTCYANNGSHANPLTGIYLDQHCDMNTISGNTCNGNQNLGGGTGYGIYIANANDDENTVMGNTALGNDTNFTDNGTNTLKQTAAADPYNNV